MSTLPHRPVVALDIDGTLGQYHRHFERFASRYTDRLLRANWKPEYRGEFSEALGLEKGEYREIKLAYRQGGQKRSMPAFRGAKELVDSIRAAGAEAWCCTTRPWQRLDNIDPDTREWFRRKELEFDGVIYGEDKYHDLLEIVGRDRVVAVLEDLPEQYITACRLFGNNVPILRFGNHNRWWREESVWYAGVDTIVGAKPAILHKIENWKKRHMESSEVLTFTHRGGRVCTRFVDGEEWHYGPNNEFVCGEAHYDHSESVLAGSIQAGQITLTSGGIYYEHPDGLKCLFDPIKENWSYEDGNGVHRCSREHPWDGRGDFGFPGIGKYAAGVPLSDDEKLDIAPGMLWATPTDTQLVQDQKVDRVCNIMDEAQTLYRRKAYGYKTADGDTANVLGAKGQFADMNRKFWRLKAMLWDEIVPMYPDKGEGESVEEILMDFIGHASLTIDFLRQAQGTKEEGPQ